MDPPQETPKTSTPTDSYLQVDRYISQAQELSFLTLGYLAWSFVVYHLFQLAAYFILWESLVSFLWWMWKMGILVVLLGWTMSTFYAKWRVSHLGAAPYLSVLEIGHLKYQLFRSQADTWLHEPEVGEGKSHEKRKL